jgi:hypothetical protein
VEDTKAFILVWQKSILPPQVNLIFLLELQNQHLTPKTLETVQINSMSCFEEVLKAILS